MQRKGCIFCGIARGEIQAYKIYEGRDYLAFLDIFPNTRGQAVLIPKRHAGSIFSELGDKELMNFIVAAKKVSNIIRRRLDVQRVNLVFEGTGVAHLHAKLYPTAGVSGKETITYEHERVYMSRYKGYITTLLGPRASDASLRRVQKEILGGGGK